MKKNCFLFVVICSFFFVAVGCFREEQPLTVGEEVEVTAETVGPEGGTIRVNQPGDPLDGLIIKVPEGAYDNATTFTISYRTVLDHQLESHFNPLTPLMRVENGGTFAKEIISVTIPLNVSEGSFSMAFFYDESTGELEGIPTLEQDQTSITFGTKHFSDFIISFIDELVLINQIDTGFKHGIDDWQFVNQGSYIAPQGHCTGQCLAAIYYYKLKMERNLPQLYGRFDNSEDYSRPTPGFQYDDEEPYKLCSVIHTELNWDSKSRADAKKRQKLDKRTVYFNFAYAMLLTGDPQLVEMWPDNESKLGHAMIVYKKSGKETGTGGAAVSYLYVSDPNYPITDSDKSERKIVFNIDNGIFEPYISKPKDGDAEETYPNIYYTGRETLISWSDVRTYWNDFASGIVSVGEGKFPEYEITVKDKDDNQLTSDVILFSNEYKTSSEQATFHLNIDPNFARATLFDQATNELGIFDKNMPRQVLLKQGENLYGCYVQGKKIHKDGEEEWLYVGFDWIKIIREAQQQLQYNFCSITVNVMGQFNDSEGKMWSEIYSNSQGIAGSFSGNTFTGSWHGDPSSFTSANGTIIVNPTIPQVNSFDMKVFHAYQFARVTVDWGITGSNLQETFNEPAIGMLEFGTSGEDVYNHISSLTYKRKSIDEFGEEYWKELQGFTCNDNSSVSVTFVEY